jgi:hypothetical protein
MQQMGFLDDAGIGWLALGVDLGGDAGGLGLALAGWYETPEFRGVWRSSCNILVHHMHNMKKKCQPIFQSIK